MWLRLEVMTQLIAPATTPPDTAEESDVTTWLVLVSLMLGAFAYGVLAAVMLPALPFFETELRTDGTGVTWLLTAFFLSAAGSTAILGRLGDMYGKRRMLLVTLAILAVGTLISAASSSVAPEIVGRALQGAGGGLFPLAFGIVRDEFPHERIAGAIAALTGMISLGSAGVVLPGLLLPALSWSWLFWIPFILTVIALLGTWLYVKESPIRSGGRLNWLNAALMMLGVTGIIIGISEGGDWGWTSGRTLGLLVGGAAVCGLWVFAELVSTNPVFNLHLMRERPVWSTNVFAFMVGAGMYGSFAVYPIYAELPTSTGFAYGASMMESGLYLLPMVAPMGLAGLVARHLTAAFGASRVLVAGSIVTAVGFGAMVPWHEHPYEMMISLALAGTGFGLVLTTLFTVVVHAVPGPNVGEVSGMNTVIRFIGGAVGTQVVSSLISGRTVDGLPVLHGFLASFVALAICMVVAVGAGLTVRPTHDAEVRAGG